MISYIGHGDIHRSPMKRGAAYGLASAALFGISTPIAKILVDSVSPVMLAGLLYAGSGFGLLVLLASRRLSRKRSPISMPRGEEWVWLTGAILLGGVFGPVALMYGLTVTAASTASLLLNLEAVFTALIAWLLFRENFDRRIAFGMLAIVAGGLVLAWSPDQVASVSSGAVFIIVACGCWALDNNLTRKASTSDAVLIAGVKGLVAGAVNVTLALSLGQHLPAMATLAVAGAVGFLGYGVSLVLFVLALRDLGSARAGAYFAVAPFFGTGVALLLGDAVTWQLVVAGVLMMSGVWLHVTESHTHEHVHERLEHTHAHTHDEHHRHAHGGWYGPEPHTHLHVHERLVHSHPHYPDVHHRHPH
jgi:drug/metabolite transporter (DMT)-like permease